MAVFLNVPTNSSDWVDICAVSGIPEGTGMVIQNISSNSVYLVEASTKPDAASNNGPILFDAASSTSMSFAIIQPASLKMWAKNCDNGATSTLSVYE